MDKIFNVLNKVNKRYLYKEDREVVKHYQPIFKHQGLSSKVSNDMEYIDFSIKVTSHQNMSAIRENFINIRNSLGDIWSVISYTEKKFLVYRELQPVIDQLKYFVIDDKRYYISYFDDLINAYYDHEMLMFEHDNYRYLLFDYQKLVIDPQPYQLLPLKADFGAAQFVVGDDLNYVLYATTINRFYLSNGKSMGLVTELSVAQIVDIGKLLFENRKVELIDYLINQSLVNEKYHKKLLKIKGDE